MQTRTVGILAHVDAGKTTLSEQILYQAHTIRQAGRVDNRDSFLDTDPLEKQRGITIFSGQAPFFWEDCPWYLLDTPGHADFSPEMERCIPVMDAAIVVVSATEGIQGHTETIWRLLRRFQVPTFFFLNKTDLPGAQPQEVREQLRQRFHTLPALSEEGITTEMTDAAAEENDVILERYLAGDIQEEEWPALLLPVLRAGKLCPCIEGAALQGKGIQQLLHILHLLIPQPGGEEDAFSARVYQVRRDLQGNRLAFLRITGGHLAVKDSIQGEKIHELRRYSGAKFQPIREAVAGELCVALGLGSVTAGESIGNANVEPALHWEPMLSAAVLYDQSQCNSREMVSRFRLLADEEPAIRVEWLEEVQEIRVQVMGIIQLEVLEELFRQRFSQEISFGPCRVVYRETIASPVDGWGHFEPLRHYAEVHLRLEPGGRGSGLVFESHCSTDRLSLNWQRLIETHVHEKEHKGVLTGSPVTDLRVVLLDGRSHEKHTEGGDFREATYRAIRHGLMKAESILLEPWYAFTAVVPNELIGRFLSDIQKYGCSFDAPLADGETSSVSGRGPVAALMEYPREFASYTRGRGSLSFRFDGYEPCREQEKVVEEIGYSPERDVENPAGSVFCSHGAGFLVPWQEAEGYMHLK